MWKISEAIHVLPLKSHTLPPATTTNMSVVGKKKFIVVDPAPPFEGEQSRLDAYIAKRQSAGHGFHAIILTHHHGDHSHDAVRLSKKFGVPIWAHEKTSELLALKVDRNISDKEIVFEGSGFCLSAIFTPGHAQDHLCFFESASGVLIAGDMVASVGSILIEPNGGNLKQYLNSLESLIELKPQAVIPAHGQPSLGGDNLLKRTLAHRLERVKAVKQILKTDYKASVETILNALYRDKISDLALPLARLSIQSTMNYLSEISG